MADRPILTILTDPVPFGRYAATEGIKNVLRRTRNAIRSPLPYAHSSYRGHFAVTRSLVEGLRKIGANANYNPRSLSEVADTVIVLSGIPALRQAVKLKRAGQIRRLLAGPNILVFPSEHDRLIASPEIDVCITPCDWTCQMYIKDCPDLQGRCVPWPAGVDTKYWSPRSEAFDRQNVLIYEKQVKGAVGPVDGYVNILQLRGYDVEVIQYGQYSAQKYLRKLRKAVLMVGFSRGESQGLAWAEAWSTDVPTLIWRNEENVYQGRVFACSTAPYLGAQTGLFFDALADFGGGLSYWESHRYQFRPREWVLENMSDEVCATKLLDIAVCVAETVTA